MPVQPPGVWGIDLGQCGLKAIRLQEIDGQVVATAFDYVEHPKILSQPDADPDQLTREALDKFLSRNNLRGDIVAISVPGQSGLARFVKLPPVEEKKIADIVRFEAKQQIPFNLEEVVWDYQKIGSGIVTDGFAMETEIGLFAMKRDMVGRYLQHFKDVGVEVHLVQMAPLALCNFVAFDLLVKDAGVTEPSGDQKRCIVALDIGADSSNLVITDGERIIWQRPIPLGGNHFTRALTKDLKLTFAKAEHLKRNATKSPDLKKILAALRPVLNDFVGEVQRSLGYFTNTHRDAHIEYMVGLGNAFRLPGLQKFLSEKLQIEVRKLGKMERVSGDQVVAQQIYTENILTFAVAYGLALQGLKRSRLLTNLLPGEIRVERLVKAKKPFAVAAAAALLLAAGGLTLSYALEFRTFGDKRVTDAMKASDTISKRAEDANKEFETARSEALAEEAAVRTIVAGQFERDNWLQLTKFINAAIPQPNGSSRTFSLPEEYDEPLEEVTIPNIPNEYKKEYWTQTRPGGVSGENAYKEYFSRQISTSSGKDDAGDMGKGIEDLIQYNIESVDAFYCDNLSGFWTQVKGSDKVKNNGKGMVRPESDFAKNPEGSGWVVEIQGYTYHQGGETFIRRTLLENLARLGNPKAAAAPPAAGAPPVAPAPGGQAVPPPAAAENEAAPDLGPILNRISHVVLYQYQASSGQGPPEMLGATVHGQVKAMALTPAASKEGATGEAGGSMMGGMAGGMMTPNPSSGMGNMMGGAGGAGGAEGEKAGPVAPTRDTWTPLGSTGSAQGPGLGAGGMMRPPVGGSIPPAPMGGSMMPKIPGGTPQPGLVPPSGPQTPAPAAGAEGGPKRTEFVILFVWKEPIPSDALRGQTVSSDASGGQTAAAAPSGKGPPTRSRSRRPRGDRKRKDK